MTDKTRDDLKTLAADAARARQVQQGYRLTVVEGLDAGQSLELAGSEGERLLVGQSPVCDLKLTDRRVSRRHLGLELVARDARVVLALSDLGSTNGTEVNGVLVTEATLRGGERIRIGDTLMEVATIATGPQPDARAQTSFGRFLGASPQIQRLYPRCEKLAAASVPVLIEGDTGTGKEVMAEALHEASPRSGEPFVVFDCTAVTPNLLESALFGHTKGSFTGATEARAGVFELADQGTLFIDEIGDLELPLQAKLLRAIERSEVQRIGAARWTRVDVRIITATRRNLDQLVEEGRFRDDLFFRVAVGRIELPPLRNRTGDVELLAAHFWHELGGEGGTPGALLDRLGGYAWPGNVRELRNTVAGYLALGELADEPMVQERMDAAEDAISQIVALDLPFSQARQKLLSVFQRRYVEHLLEQHDGNVTQAAKASGLALRYFQLLRARSRDD